jgi:DNA-binding transcriptional ArsR family regulator
MLNSATRVGAMSRLGRAMSDPTRCRILLRLADGPAYPSALADELDLTRPNVSNHLTCLRGCGLVVAAPEGRRVRYELAASALARGLHELLEATLAVDACPVCDGSEPAEGCTHEMAL